MARVWLVLGAVGALVAVAPARAAAPWSDPQPLGGAAILRWSGQSLEQLDPQLAFTPGGNGIAVLGRQDGGWGITRWSGRRGGFTTLKPSALGGLVPRLIATYGRDGVLLGGQVVVPGAPVGVILARDAAVTRGDGSGRFARAQVLGRGLSKGGNAPAYIAALAADQAGDAAAVVSAPFAGRTRVAGYRSTLWVRRRGQPAFGRVATIGRRTVGPSPAALAINGPGDVLVAWDDRESVRARLLSAAGRLGREQRLGVGRSYLYGERLVAAMDGTRRMLVAWMAQRVGEGSYAGAPGTVAVAYAPPYGAFGPARVVQRGLPQGEGRAIRGRAVQAALLRDRGVVVWTGYDGGTYRVRTVDVTSTGPPTAARNLSDAGVDAQLQGLATGARGATVALWFERTRGTPSPLSALRADARAAGTSAWGAPEDVAPWAAGAPAPPAAVAASPVSGEAVAIWSDPVATAPAPVPVRFSLRAPSG